MPTPVRPIGPADGGGTLFEMDAGPPMVISGTPGVVNNPGFARPMDAGPGPSDAGAPVPMVGGAADAGPVPLPTSPGPSDGGAPAWSGGTPTPADPYAQPPQTSSAPTPAPSAVAPASSQPWVQGPDGKWGPAPAGPGITDRLRVPWAAPGATSPAGTLGPGQVQLPQGGRGPGGPSYSKQAGAAFDQEAKAQQAMGNSLAQQAEMKGRGMQEIAGQEQAALRQAQTQRDAVQKEYRARMDQLNAAQEQLDQQKEDPNRWWSSRDTGQKMAATISLALGSLGQAFTGHNGSPVPDLINKDIEAQRQNYQRSKDSIAAKRSAYGQLREQGLSDVEAGLVLKRGQLDAAQKMLEGQITASTPAYIKAQAAQEAAKLQVEKAKTNAQLDNEAAQTAHARVATEAARQQQLWAQQDRANMQAFYAGKEGAQVPPQLREQAVWDPRTKQLLGIAASPKEAPELRKMVSDSSTLHQDIAEAKRLAQEWFSSSDKSKAGLAYKTKMDSILGKLNPSQGNNYAMDSQTKEMWLHTLGNSATTPTDATLAALEALAGSVRTNVNNTLAGQGPGMRPMYGAEPTQGQAQTLAAAGVR